MSKPGIELRWADSMSDPLCRQAVRPIMRRMIEATEAGFNDFGLPITDTKRLIVHLVSPRFTYHADAPTSKTMNLYLKPGIFTGRYDEGFHCRTIFHEMIHAHRQERFPVTTVAELSATEGLAYVGDYLFTPHVSQWRTPRVPVVERVQVIPTEQLQAMRADLEPILDDDLWKEGGTAVRERKHPGFPIRLTDIIGIAAVAKHLQDGQTIRDLIYAPAQQVLGYRSNSIL